MLLTTAQPLYADNAVASERSADGPIDFRLLCWLRFSRMFPKVCSGFGRHAQDVSPFAQPARSGSVGEICAEVAINQLCGRRTGGKVAIPDGGPLDRRLGTPSWPPTEMMLGPRAVEHQPAGLVRFVADRSDVVGGSIAPHRDDLVHE